MEAPKTMLTCMHIHPVDSPYTADDIKKSKAIRLVATVSAGICLLMACVSAGGSGSYDYVTIADVSFASWEESMAVATTDGCARPQKVFFGLFRMAVETPCAHDTYGNEVTQAIHYDECQKATMVNDVSVPLIPKFAAEMCHDCKEATDDIETSFFFGVVMQVLVFPFSIMRMSESMNSSGSKIFVCVWLFVSALLFASVLSRFAEGCYKDIPDVGADREYGPAFMMLFWVIILDIFSIVLHAISQSNPLIPAGQAIPFSPLCCKKMWCTSAPVEEETTKV